MLFAKRLYSIACHPKGTGYAIGGEDGYVRIHHFDDDFYRQSPYGKELNAED